MQNTLLALSLFSLLSISHAETCPTIDDLHNQNLHGWRAFDIDNGTLLTIERLITYTQSTQQLALVEWMDEAPEGSAHCYYYGAQEDPGYLGAFLAKQGLFPDHWEGPNRDVMQCMRGINECRFMEK